MNKLIFQPLVKSSISTVIVIDALDECRDGEPSSTILSVLRQFATEISKVRISVTGRPEPHIRDSFRLLRLAEATDVFFLHEVEQSQVNRDVRLFFRHNLLELKERQNILGDWPAEGQLDLLCERSAGLFVHAIASIDTCGVNEGLDATCEGLGGGRSAQESTFRELGTRCRLLMLCVQRPKEFRLHFRSNQLSPQILPRGYSNILTRQRKEQG